MRLAKTILLAGTALLIAAPAAAQKSKDTLRLAINDPFTVLSAYYVPVDEAGNFYRKVYPPDPQDAGRPIDFSDATFLRDYMRAARNLARSPTSSPWKIQHFTPITP